MRTAGRAGVAVLLLGPALREWSVEQEGLLPERQRKRERLALARYLDAIVRDETGVWAPLAAARGGVAVAGAMHSPKSPNSPRGAADAPGVPSGSDAG